MSRTVMREATKRLESQGLLEIRHGSGTWVVNQLHKPVCGSLSLAMPKCKERLRQLNEARLLVEPEIARQAAQKRWQKKTVPLQTDDLDACSMHDGMLTEPRSLP